MNKFAKAWVKALRSGKYRQGRGFLTQRDDSKHLQHCCLGVACQIDDRVSVSPGEIYIYDGFEETELSSEAAERLGLSSTTGEFEINKDVYEYLVANAKHFILTIGDHTSLVTCNDEYGLNFNQIADIIEMEPPGLFK